MENADALKSINKRNAKSVKALKALFSKLEENKGDIVVSAIEDKEIIIVTIKGEQHRVNIAMDSVNAAIKDVVNAVIYHI